MLFCGQSKREGTLVCVTSLEKNNFTFRTPVFFVMSSAFVDKTFIHPQLPRANSFDVQLNHREVIAWLMNYPQTKSEELAAPTF
jgi:hypothetical protein